jgi:hypothetical protein
MPIDLQSSAQLIVLLVYARPRRRSEIWIPGSRFFLYPVVLLILANLLQDFWWFLGTKLREGIATSLSRSIPVSNLN